MGYTTDFEGTLQFNKEVTEELKNFINGFSDVRHMKRDVEKIKEVFPNWKKKCYNGNLGVDGEYFIGGKGYCGQDEDCSIIDYNFPPKSQPGLWCQWMINDDGELEWDGGEKFYNYEEWLIYLIENFFKPEGYVLNGIISFQGEDPDDFGDIVVIDNTVRVGNGYYTEENDIEEEEEICLDDFSDDDLISELKSRGYVVGAAI